MRRDPIRALVLRLTVVAALVLVLASAAALGYALERFEQPLAGQLRLNAQEVAASLSRQVTRAADLGIALDKLPGLDEAIRLGIEPHGEIAHAQLQDRDGRILARFARGPGDAAPPPAADDIVLELRSHGQRVGVLRMGLDPGHAATVFTSLLADVAPAMLVSLLVTFEVLLRVVQAGIARLEVHRRALAVAGPVEAGGDAPRLVLLRLPVFLVCLGEEVTRPFMPAYARDLAATAPWLAQDVVVGLPITVFMASWALSQPLGARLAGRWGHHLLFAASGGVAALALALSAGTGSLAVLLLLRCVGAAGYGMALIVAQGLLIDLATSANRTRAMAHYIGALLAAGVCGPVIGGILADEAGPRAALLAGAAIALLGAVLLPGHRGQARGGSRNRPTRPAAAGMPAAVAKTLFRNRRFVGLMLLSAMPTKVAATGILFCLVPLALDAAGASKAQIGSVQMMYFLGYMAVAPVVATLSDRWSKPGALIAGGGLVTLLAVGPLVFWPGLGVAMAAIGLFGIAQAFIGAPQMALLADIAERAGTEPLQAVAWYRLLERAGGALGPLLAVGFAALSSYSQAMALIGAACAACSLAFWCSWRRQALAPPPEN